MTATNPGTDPREILEVPLADPDQTFRTLVEAIRDYAIFMLDAGGKVATWNTGAERIKGYRADEIIGRHFCTFYPPEVLRSGKCDAILETVARDGRFEEEGWRVRKDGSRFWASVVINAIRDADGVLVGFSKVVRDLTERKLAEATRFAAEERFRMLVDSVRDYAIFMLDPKGHVVTWNEGAERVEGYRVEDIVGRHFSTFYTEADVRNGKCEVELEVAAQDGRFEDEGWRVRRDGSRFWADVVISAVRDPRGELVGFANVTRDLTERRRAETDRTARKSAEQANRAKDEFLAMLGHELRNPLAPIATALQLMKLRGQTSNEQQIIERQLAHLMRLVDDLLDVSRIIRGKVALRVQRLDVREVVARAIETASTVVEAKEHHLEVDIGPGDLYVDGDQARLVQVFTNLIVNAAKYTDPCGHIWIVVRGADDSIVVDVRDDGTGMDATLVPRVFDLFVQGYQGIERSRGGLGLGLTLVRKLVERHDGSVEAHSRGVGKGSTFSVRLPRAAAEPPVEVPQPTEPVARIPLAGRRVLLVDDNEDALMVLGDLLTAAGHEVRTALDPANALAIARTFHPEVAILDIGLPMMDGYELARRLRAQAGADKLQLVALTGYGQQSDRARADQAGFDAHFVKPVELRRLMAAIAKR